MHVIGPEDTAWEPSEGGPFRTLLPPEVGGALAVYLLAVSRSEPHVHDDEDQVYIVRQGRGLMAIDEERREIGPGDLVYIPRGSRHSLATLGDQPVELYSLLHRVP